MQEDGLNFDSIELNFSGNLFVLDLLKYSNVLCESFKQECLLIALNILL